MYANMIIYYIFSTKSRKPCWKYWICIISIMTEPMCSIDKIATGTKQH